MTTRNLDALFDPDAVALVGASGREGSLGAVLLDRLRPFGEARRLGLVNPKHDRIGDLPCVPRATDLPFRPDLGVVSAPAAAAPRIIADLGAAGARAAVVISAGFDAKLRQAMLDAARPHMLRIVGPNCLGFQAPGIGLDASFAHLAPRVGGLALLSQSGAIVTSMLDWAEARGIGFSTTVSMGDMADVDVGDLLDWLALDRGTKAILLYLEHVTDARKFMSAARAASRVKPVIAIKAGRSAAAARAAASHTGALAGADDVYEAALRRAGIVRVHDLEELFEAAEALARLRPPMVENLAILTNGGGAGVLAADAAAEAGVPLARFSDETLARLDAALPAAWSRGNPVDIIGDAGRDRYAAAMETLLAAPETDAILVMNCPTGLASSLDAAEAVVGTLGGARAKPVFGCWLGEATAAAGARLLEQAGAPVYATPVQAVRGVGHLVRHRRAQAELMRAPSSGAEDVALDIGAARRIVEDVLAEGREILTEPEAKAVLSACGVAAPPCRVVAGAEEAEAAAADLMAAGAERIAIKILSREITHKSDVGGVRLDIASPADARAAAAEMLTAVAAAAPGALIDGLVVQPMIRRPRAHELIVGLSDDRVFGPVVLFGAGGVSVEVVADRAVALPPLDDMLAGDMIDRTRVGRLLKGYRGTPAADRGAITDALIRIGRLAAEIPEIVELDINPLLADAEGVLALDARIVARAPRRANRMAIRPYPADWDREETVNGRAIRIRPIHPVDGALYPAFRKRISDEDMRMRFFAAVGAGTPEQIAWLTQLDYERAMAFVALDPEDGGILGVSRLAADPEREEAEFAVIVRTDRHGEGFGGALMRRLIDYARAEGIGALTGEVMAGNRPMIGLCRKLGFAVTGGDGADGIARARLTLRP